MKKLRLATLGLLPLRSRRLAFSPSSSVKIGFVMFLSGPAASPFGVPAKNPPTSSSRS